MAIFICFIFFKRCTFPFSRASCNNDKYYNENKKGDSFKEKSLKRKIEELENKLEVIKKELNDN